MPDVVGGGMWFFLGLCFLGLVLAALIMPWVQRARITRLSHEVDALQRQVAWLLSVVARKPADDRSEQKIAEVSAPHEPAPQVAVTVAQSPWKAASSVERPPIVKQVDPSKNEWKKAAAQSTRPVGPSPKKPFNFEQQFGANLPVWIGGIALALAGVFMVKYSIETGLLSPLVRLVLGGVFGVGLLGAAHWLRGKSSVPNDARIAQALSGAGLADLYACLFTATSIYHLLPAAVGFGGMALVTASAVFLSLRHGAPIALLGLVGGFLTPALVGSTEPNAPLLFVYLYALLAGFFVLIRRKNWWFLAIPTVMAAFGWVVLWMLTSFVADDGMALGLFVLAVAVTVVQQSKKAMEEGQARQVSAFYAPLALNYLCMGGGMLLMAAIAAKSNFALTEWVLFGLLTAAGLALAYFNERLYGFVPKLSLVVNVVMLLVWEGADPHILNLVLVSFALMYAISGYMLMWSARNPVSWAVLAGASSVLYYLMAYDRLRHDLLAEFSGIEVWSLLAFLLSMMSVSIVKQVMVQYTGPAATKQHMLAVFALTATAFLSFGFFIALKAEFLTMALAAEILAVCWINTKVNIAALRPIARALAITYIAFLSPQIMVLLDYMMSSLGGSSLPYEIFVPVMHAPLLHLGFPALMFAASSLLLRRQLDDKLVRHFELVAVGLASIMVYFVARHIFHIDENILLAKAGFAERGVISNLLLLMGLGTMWAGRRWNRLALSQSGVVLAAAAMLRIAYFDFLIHNPLWSHQMVGTAPLLNALFINYGLPVVGLLLVNQELRRGGKEALVMFTNPCLLVLAFALVSLNVRQMFQGEYLDGAFTSNAEVYAYSAAWLVMGIALLFIGTYRRDKALRLASLAFVMVSVGKVFLYDASELTGLLRVFSFLGLGVSLIGLSWFYTRFIANRG